MMKKLLMLLLFFVQFTHAEGVLLESTPKDNSLMTTFDNKISLVFSGNVSERTPTLVVVDKAGNRVDNKDVKLVLGDRSLLTATTKNLTVGRYAVRYRVVTEDGLIVSGVTRFEIKS